ncbi:unnamed protein product [Prorocentrum cordatum]|uniref:Uncharacterized protein n=1 Tax=Prorocentrum cordatum TaxID=2364126 RepID=A0ABN9WJL7_9DINO|nr:unnamed protein product [Polarella glacialis]
MSMNPVGLERILGFWADEDNARHKVVLDPGGRSCSVETTGPAGQRRSGKGLVRLDEEGRVALGQGFVLDAERMTSSGVFWRPEGRGRGFEWRRCGDDMELSAEAGRSPQEDEASCPDGRDSGRKVSEYGPMLRLTGGPGASSLECAFGDERGTGFGVSYGDSYGGGAYSWANGCASQLMPAGVHQPMLMLPQVMPTLPLLMPPYAVPGSDQVGNLLGALGVALPYPCAGAPQSIDAEGLALQALAAQDRQDADEHHDDGAKSRRDVVQL